MANLLTNIQHKILARGLLALREWVVMPRLVNSDYGRDARERGDTIDVPIPSAVPAREVSPAEVPPAPGDSSPTKAQIQLNQWYEAPFHLTDKDMAEVAAGEHFLPMQTSEALRSLANQVNQHVASKYLGVYGVVGTPGTTPFGSTVADATNTRKVLNQQRAPLENRRAVVDFDAEAAMLALQYFSDVDKVGETAPKIEGEIGRKFGTDWYANHNVPTHTAGTLSDGTNPEALVNGALTAGATSVSIDETTLTGTVLVGDIISFAGHSQTYTVTANTSSAQYAAGTGDNGGYTAAGNAIADITFYPALQEAVADGETMTLTQTHVVNLVFHRDAFAFANRPLVDSSSLGSQLGSRFESMQDPMSGIVLRLEISRQHKQTQWSFDILWGAELIRPELAVRLAG